MSRYIKIIDGALSQSLCSDIVAKFQRDARVTEDPQPDFSSRTYLFATEHADWRELLLKVAPIAYQLMLSYFDELRMGPEEWIDDGYVIAHYRTGDTCFLHDDGQTSEANRNGLRLVTLLFYLNDAQGGETVFPNQGVHVAPKMGRAVLFPAQLTHPHEVLAAASDRYILQTWITDPQLIVIENVTENS